MKSLRNVELETELIMRAKCGDEQSFARIMDIHRPALMSLAMRLLRNHDDASDAVQETIVKAYRAIKDFDMTRPLKPWLCRICSNCCVDTVRSRQRDGFSLDQTEYEVVDSRNIEEDTTGALRQAQIVAAIERLPARYRRIILMRHFKHMDVVEIANALNKPEGTIKSWLFRARNMLKLDLSLALA